MDGKRNEALTVYFRDEETLLYEALRKMSFESKQSMTGFIKQALKKELKKLKYL